MRIIELTTDKDFIPLYPLIAQLNPGMSKKRFHALLTPMRKQGYRCIVAVDKQRYLGACGFWSGTRFWCGPFIDVDNVVVDEAHRSRALGKKLIAWVEKEARRRGCAILGLDVYTTSHGAHRFYLREGFIIKGYHLIKPLVASKT